MSRLRPTIGQIVFYRGRAGLQTVRAAIITATVDTLDPRGVAAGHVPSLSGPDHVHLWVFTPAAGGPNSSAGGFAEFNIPYSEPANPHATEPYPSPGAWCWPGRIAQPGQPGQPDQPG